VSQTQGLHPLPQQSSSLGSLGFLRFLIKSSISTIFYSLLFKHVVFLLSSTVNYYYSWLLLDGGVIKSFSMIGTGLLRGISYRIVSLVEMLYSYIESLGSNGDYSIFI
jgi:hypothetical protein